MSVEYCERKNEEGGREGERQKHTLSEREREREREKQPSRERELAVWWPCITHVRAALHVGLGASSRSGGTSFYRRLVAGAA